MTLTCHSDPTSSAVVFTGYVVFDAKCLSKRWSVSGWGVFLNYFIRKIQSGLAEIMKNSNKVPQRGS